MSGLISASSLCALFMQDRMQRQVEEPISSQTKFQQLPAVDNFPGYSVLMASLQHPVFISLALGLVTLVSSI